MASGLVVLVPILVTLWFILWLYSTLATIPIPKQVIWAALLGADQTIDERIGVLLTIGLSVGTVVVTGYLMRSAIGRLLERRFDALINRLPGLRIVYNASKTAASTALTDGVHRQAPVKITLWNGMRLTAFQTGKRTADGRLLVFLPTSPNVTSGLLLEVEPEDIIGTDEPIEHALGRILSAGLGDTDTRNGENRHDRRKTGSSTDR